MRWMLRQKRKEWFPWRRASSTPTSRPTAHDAEEFSRRISRLTKIRAAWTVIALYGLGVALGDLLSDRNWLPMFSFACIAFAARAGVETSINLYRINRDLLITNSQLKAQLNAKVTNVIGLN